MRCTITVPTIHGLHLGPMEQVRDDVEGFVGCYVAWQSRIRMQLPAALADKFEEVSDERLDKLTDNGLHDIISHYADDTLTNLRRALSALRAGWIAVGYEP